MFTQQMIKVIYLLRYSGSNYVGVFNITIPSITNNFKIDISLKLNYN